MDWVKLGARYYRDVSIRAAGEAAEVLFLRGLAYCGDEETGGFIPADMIAFLTPTRGRKRAQALVDNELWQPVDGGYQITRWDEWQASLEGIAERRRVERDKKRRQRSGTDDGVVTTMHRKREAQ